VMTGELIKLRRISRRALVRGALAGTATLALGNSSHAACMVTPRQAEGPFYPEHVLESDWDMTKVLGGTGRASGEVIEVIGQVRDDRCRAVGDCILEIWQANAEGRYAHPQDLSNKYPIDKNFQGYARIATDKDGHYRFMSIMPGSYPAGGDWIRPPHIHFKVRSAFSSLTTQMYFAGHEQNDHDYLLNNLESMEEKHALLVDFQQIRADGVRVGKFDLVLTRD